MPWEKQEVDEPAYSQTFWDDRQTTWDDGRTQWDRLAGWEVIEPAE